MKKILYIIKNKMYNKYIKNIFRKEKEMKKNDRKQNFEIKINYAEKLSREDMDSIYGSGNSQVRYIPDEYLQAKILREHAGGMGG